MKTVKYSVEFEEKASRLELLVRIVWAIPTYFVLIVLEIIGGICMVLQWFHILLLGKRNKMLNEWSAKYIHYAVKFMSYFFLFTDERSPLMPED